jgi:hypothetical protein
MLPKNVRTSAMTVNLYLTKLFSMQYVDADMNYLHTKFHHSISIFNYLLLSNRNLKKIFAQPPYYLTVYKTKLAHFSKFYYGYIDLGS